MDGCIKMPLCMEVGLSLGDCVRWGPTPRSPKGAEPRNFPPTSIVAKQLDRLSKIPLGMEVGLGSGNFVFHGDPGTPRRKGTPTLTQFLAHVCCGQTAGWIKMPLGMEVNVGPGDVVLDGVAAPPKRGTARSFRFMAIVAKRLDG